MSAAGPSTADGGAIDGRVWKVAAVVAMGPFMTQMDSTLVNLSLTAIGHDLHAPLATAQWLVSGYLLALALVLPINGWLVDRIGAKRLYLGCFGAFTLASLLCGAAHTMPQLIVARLLQGVAGGLMAPMTQMMIARVAGAQMARIMGFTIMPVLIAPIMGPVLAGEILQHAGWPWLFYLNVPIGLLGIALAALLLPRDDTTTSRRPFDQLGFLLISPGLVLLLYGLPHALRADGAAATLAGAALLLAFAWHARRKAGAALIDLRLFQLPDFAWAAATQCFSNGVFYARQLLAPLFLITGCALSADQAGHLIAAMGVGMLCVFPLMGKLTEHFGCRTVALAGAVLGLLGALPFLWMTLGHFSPFATAAGLFIAGAGQGMISIPSVSAAYAAVSKEQLAGANTAINIVQRLGGPLGTMVMALAVPAASAVVTAPAAASAAAPYLVAYVLLAAMQLLLVACAQRLPRYARRAALR